MNILFLNPPFDLGKISRTSRSPSVTKAGTFYYPIWLAYAAGLAEQQGFNVKLFDAPAVGADLQQTIQWLGDFSPNLIVIDTSTPSIYNDAKIAAQLKQNYPDSFITLVGTHPTALPEETLKLEDGIDAVALAEYDETISDLAAAIQNNRPVVEVNGLVILQDDKIITTPPRDKISDLDNLPFVSSVYKKHLNTGNYFFAAANYPMVMIMTGRGCPNKCFFCVYPQVFHSRKYRYRSPENVVAEFEFITQNMPEVNEIGIEDDCFTADKRRVKEICNLLIERKIKIKWYCNVRGNLDYDLLKLMKQSGCRLVTVGFESGDQNILNNINKGETVEHYLEFAKAARRAGVLVHGCMMVGNPEDTKQTLAKSYELAKQINCDSMQFYPLYVYPGTEAFNWATDNNYLKSRDFSHWLTKDGLHNCTHDTPQMSAAEMKELCDHYMKLYHFRPSYLWNKGIQAIIKPAEGARSLKSAYSFIKNILFKSA